MLRKLQQKRLQYSFRRQFAKLFTCTKCTYISLTFRILKDLEFVLVFWSCSSCVFMLSRSHLISLCLLLPVRCCHIGLYSVYYVWIYFCHICISPFPLVCGSFFCCCYDEFLQDILLCKFPHKLSLRSSWKGTYVNPRKWNEWVDRFKIAAWVWNLFYVVILF